MKNMPKALTLHSEDGHHAGFMLLASGEDRSSGDCVFILTPVSAEGIDSNLGIVVSELKLDGEQKYTCSESNSGIELAVHPRELPVVSFSLNLDFKGNIYTELDGNRKFVGTAEPAKKKA